jgi:hypothetical protein
MQVEIAALDAPDRPFVNLGVHITCNENGLDTTYRRLNDGGHHGGTRCHVGFSAWFNLDIACKRQASAIVICDANSASTRFVRHTFELVRAHTGRTAFVDAMCREYALNGDNHTLFAPFIHNRSTLLDYAKEDFIRTGVDLAARLLFQADTDFAKRRAERAEDDATVEMRLELTRQNSWLSKDASYSFIRNIILAGRAMAITCDACDVERMASVRKIVEAHGLMIDTLYVSNVEDYVRHKPERLAQYRQMLQRMTGANTITIHTDAYLTQGLVFGPLGDIGML